jgi:hypothetical protein
METSVSSLIKQLHYQSAPSLMRVQPGDLVQQVELRQYTVHRKLPQ